MRRPSLPPDQPTLVLVVGIGLVVGVVAVLLVSARKGSNDDVAGRIAVVDVAAFAGRIDDPDTFVVNVHVPYEGEIAGTNAFIAYDEIVDDDRLPADPATELLLYCRSGTMSAIAAESLSEAGYRNVVDLDGGMLAWEAAGLPILRQPPS